MPKKKASGNKKKKSARSRAAIARAADSPDGDIDEGTACSRG
jgi:hypothetical protein